MHRKSIYLDMPKQFIIWNGWSRWPRQRSDYSIPDPLIAVEGISSCRSLVKKVFSTILIMPSWGEKYLCTLRPPCWQPSNQNKHRCTNAHCRFAGRSAVEALPFFSSGTYCYDNGSPAPNDENVSIQRHEWTASVGEGTRTNTIGGHGSKRQHD